MTTATETAERLRGEAERLRDEFEHRVAPEAERIRREHLDPAVREVRERAPEYAERVAERSREAVEQAWEHAPEYAERVADAGRETAERVGSYLEEHVDEETLHTWGPRVLFALIGFVVGFLLGRAVSRREAGGAEGHEDDPGLAHAPRGDLAQLRSGARPPTRMPGVHEDVASGGDGHQNS